MSLFYKSAIERDLPHWRQKGWVSEEGAKAILADVEARTTKITIGGVFGLIAATLLCLALAAFIAANWDAIGRTTKFGLIIGLLWLAYGVSIGARLAGWGMVSHAALLIASSGFGGAIMLISQIYHLSGNPPDAVLMWAVGALIGGALLRSPPTLVLAAILIAIWGEMEAWRTWRDERTDTWMALALWLSLAAACWRTSWRGGLHVAALGIGWWVLTLSFRIDAAALREPSFGPSIFISLVALLIGAAGSLRPPLAGALGQRAPALAVYGFIIAYLSLFLWRIDMTTHAKGLAEMAPFAAIVLGFVLATLLWSLSIAHSTLSWWCYAALAGELVYLYIRTLGTLLETALFFGLAALVVILVAVTAAQMQKRKQPTEEATA